MATFVSSGDGVIFRWRGAESTEQDVLILTYRTLFSWLDFPSGAHNNLNDKFVGHTTSSSHCGPVPVCWSGDSAERGPRPGRCSTRPNTLGTPILRLISKPKFVMQNSCEWLSALPKIETLLLAGLLAGSYRIS